MLPLPVLPRIFASVPFGCFNLLCDSIFFFSFKTIAVLFQSIWKKIPAQKSVMIQSLFFLSHTHNLFYHWNALNLEKTASRLSESRSIYKQPIIYGFDLNCQHLNFFIYFVSCFSLFFSFSFFHSQFHFTQNIPKFCEMILSRLLLLFSIYFNFFLYVFFFMLVRLLSLKLIRAASISPIIRIWIFVCALSIAIYSSNINDNHFNSHTFMQHVRTYTFVHIHELKPQ